MAVAEKAKTITFPDGKTYSFWDDEKVRFVRFKLAKGFYKFELPIINSFARIHAHGQEWVIQGVTETDIAFKCYEFNETKSDNIRFCSETGIIIIYFESKIDDNYFVIETADDDIITNYVELSEEEFNTEHTYECEVKCLYQVKDFQNDINTLFAKVQSLESETELLQSNIDSNNTLSDTKIDSVSKDVQSVRELYTDVLKSTQDMVNRTANATAQYISTIANGGDIDVDKAELADVVLKLAQTKNDVDVNAAIVADVKRQLEILKGYTDIYGDDISKETENSKPITEACDEGALNILQKYFGSEELHQMETFKEFITEDDLNQLYANIIEKFPFVSSEEITAIYDNCINSNPTRDLNSFYINHELDDEMIETMEEIISEFKGLNDLNSENETVYTKSQKQLNDKIKALQNVSEQTDNKINDLTSKVANTEITNTETQSELASVKSELHNLSILLNELSESVENITQAGNDSSEQENGGSSEGSGSGSQSGNDQPSESSISYLREQVAILLARVEFLEEIRHSHQNQEFLNQLDEENIDRILGNWKFYKLPEKGIPKSDLSAEVLDVMADVDNFAGRIEFLKGMIESNSSRISGIEATLGEYEKKIVKNQNDIKTLQTKVTTLETKTASMETKISTMEHTIELMRTAIVMLGGVI